MFPAVSLVIGGAASGKSDFAEGLVRSAGRGCVYLATARPLDGEMRGKIRAHQDARGPVWTTIEEPLDVGRALATISGDQAVLLDCATMWLSNHLGAQTDLTEAEAGLMAGLALSSAPVVIVTNEVGHGIVPGNALARGFREAQGRLNQKLAARADLVVNVIAGLPQVLKGALP